MTSLYLFLYLFCICCYTAMVQCGWSFRWIYERLCVFKCWICNFKRTRRGEEKEDEKQNETWVLVERRSGKFIVQIQVMPWRKMPFLFTLLDIYCNTSQHRDIRRHITKKEAKQKQKFTFISVVWSCNWLNFNELAYSNSLLLVLVAKSFSPNSKHQTTRFENLNFCHILSLF